MKTTSVMPMVALCCVAANPIRAETESNSISGSIYRSDDQKPFSEHDATAEVKGTNIKDDTDRVGRYGLAIPSDIKTYQLIYSAVGYFSDISLVKNNDQASQKLDNVFLQQANARNNIWRDTKQFGNLLDTQIQNYQASIIELTRITIKNNLDRFVIDLRSFRVLEGLIPQREKAVQMASEALGKMYGGK
jgi:hypothetical protein